MLVVGKNNLKLHHFISRKSSTKEINQHKHFSLIKRNSKKFLTKPYEKIIFNHLEVSIQNCILSLSKEPFVRNQQDIMNVKYIIEKSSLANKFKEDKICNEILDKMLTLCATEMKHLYLESGTTLFRIGDKGDKFYIIIHGKVAVLKPRPKESIMSGFNYFRLLMELKVSKENYILKQTIDTNQKLVKIDIEDLQELQLLIFRTKLQEYFSKLNQNNRTIKDIMKLCYIQSQFFDFEIDEGLLIQDEGYKYVIENRIMDMFSDLDNDKLIKNKILTNENNKVNFIIYEYQSIIELEQGAFFGDVALDKQKTRNATIKTLEDTHFCYLHCKHYSSFIKQEKQRLNLKEINFLLVNFFFDELPFPLFERLFSNFIHEEKINKNIIIQEGTPVKYIYFIKEGNIELTTSKSLYELFHLTSKLHKKKFQKKFKSSKLISFDKGPFAIPSKILKEKMNNRLFVLGSKETIGLDCLGFNVEFQYSAQVISDKAKLYKIETKVLDKLLKFQSKILPQYEKSLYNKMEVFLERLITIFNKKSEIKHNERNEKLALLDQIVLSQKKEKSKMNSPCSYKMKSSSGYLFDEYYVNKQNKIKLSNPLTQRNSKKKVISFTTNPSPNKQKQMSLISEESKEYLTLLKHYNARKNNLCSKKLKRRTSAFSIKHESQIINKVKLDLENDNLFLTKLPSNNNINNTFERNTSFIKNRIFSKRVSSPVGDKNNKRCESNTERASTVESKGLLGLNSTCVSNGNIDFINNYTPSTASHRSIHSALHKDHKKLFISKFNYRQKLVKCLFNK